MILFAAILLTDCLKFLKHPENRERNVSPKGGKETQVFVVNVWLVRH